MKTFPLILASLLLGVFALNVPAQNFDFALRFVPPTNAAAAGVTAYVMKVSTNGVTQWAWNGWCPAATNQINFVSANLPSNPCWLTVVTTDGKKDSDYARALPFDVNWFTGTNKPPTVDPVTTLPLVTVFEIIDLRTNK